MGLISYFKPKGEKATAAAEAAPADISLPAVDSALEDQLTEQMNNLKCDIMADYLHQQQLQRRWQTGGLDEGVVLKKSRNSYSCCPSELSESPAGFQKMIEQLNVRVAMTVNTPVIKRFKGRSFVSLPNGLRLQVLPDISYLPHCQKHQSAAYIDDRGTLIVWDDDPRDIVERAARLERELLHLIWQGDLASFAVIDNEKYDKMMKSTVTSAAVSECSISDTSSDLEAGAATTKAPSTKRKTPLLLPCLVLVTVFLTVLSLGTGYRRMAIELAYDGSYMRFVLIVIFPLAVWISLFFFLSLTGNVLYLFGPIKQLVENTKYYSGTRPERLTRDYPGGLPHLTIQMPVYKEGLEAVIIPTIRSMKAAMSTYEMQGGTANIFVNDDGMQLIDEKERLARQEFYEEHNIGWVARPKHNPKPAEGEEAFVRRGKFKKASNMNYALWVSNRVEELLAQVPRHPGWSAADESNAYRMSLAQVIEDDQGRTWADGNVRIGDYILIIDSDTRVPKDCFLDAVSEMEQNPNVAIIQYASGVMNVTNTFFENGITWFTNLVYTAIKWAVASGDVAPFVGHNAILRWEALQYLGYTCEYDDREKFWAENTVSEDFDMALRLQAAGYIVRLAGYTAEDGEVYREGVSLTVYDELARWEKYAYGCSELMFNPLRYWFTRSPFTPLFRRFIRSPMPLHSKFTIMAYIGTYYAIGSACPLTFMNYFLIGWFQGYLDQYYLPSFQVYCSLIVVFVALGNVSLAVMRFRTGQKGIFSALFENFSWILMFNIFLGGISLHVSQALCCHLVGIDMQWGATAKELENTTFFQEIRKVAWRFKYTFAFCILSAAMMVLLAHGPFVPVAWRITTITAIWPLTTVVVSHFLLPIVLNPNLIVLKW